MLYHLSENKNLSKLTPRIPECAISMYENVSIERICFSDSIDGCLSALQDCPCKYYVYIPDEELDNDDIYYPTVDEVRDAKYTHEVWVMKEIKVRCLGKIESFMWDSSKNHNSGRGRVTIFHYPYKWIENYDNNINNKID